MSELLRFRSAMGVDHVVERDTNGDLVDRIAQPVGDILDANKAMANHNDGYTASREMRRVASIPVAVILKWKIEEGWDAFDPACADKLREKLNSSEWSFLRTAGGRLGKTSDGGFR